MKTLRRLGQLLIAPVVVPRLRRKRLAARPEVLAAAARVGLHPGVDADEPGVGLRLLGRVESRPVLVKAEILPPTIRVLFRFRRSFEVAFPADRGTRSLSHWFDVGDPAFDGVFGKRFTVSDDADPEAFRAGMRCVAGFTTRFRPLLRNCLITDETLVAALEHYPFVPTIRPDVLEAVVPALVRTAVELEAHLGPGATKVAIEPFLRPGESF